MCAVFHGCCSVFGSFVFLGLLPLRRQVRLRGAEDDLGLCNAQIGPVVVVSLRVTRSWGYVPPEAQNVVLGWQDGVACLSLFSSPGS